MGGFLSNINDRFSFNIGKYEIEPKDLAIGLGTLVLTGGVAAPLVYGGYNLFQQNQSESFEKGTQIGNTISDQVVQASTAAAIQAESEAQKDVSNFIWVGLGIGAILFIIIMLIWLNKAKK